MKRNDLEESFLDFSSSLLIIPKFSDIFWEETGTFKMKPKTENLPSMLKSGQVRQMLGVSKNVFTDLIRAKAFPNAVRLGTQYRVPRTDVEAYLAARVVATDGGVA